MLAPSQQRSLPESLQQITSDTPQKVSDDLVYRPDTCRMSCEASIEFLSDVRETLRVSRSTDVGVKFVVRPISFLHPSGSVKFSSYHLISYFLCVSACGRVNTIVLGNGVHKFSRKNVVFFRILT